MNLIKYFKYYFNKNYLSNFITILLEKLNGLDFTSIILAEDVGLDSNLSFRSSPTGVSELRAVLFKLNIKQSDKILDIGCGKGKAMSVMLEFPFSRVDGIEISDTIALIAINNILKLKQSNRSNVECINALNFANYSDYNIFYFYNPFPKIIMEQVFSNILNAVNSNKEIIIIYNNPTCEDVILNYGSFNEVFFIKNEWGDLMKVFSNKKLSNS